MKKLLALILAVALVLALAACGNKENEENTPTSDPTVNDSPTEEVNVEITEKPSEEGTEDPDATDAPDESENPKATDAPAATAAPTQKPADKPTTAPTNQSVGATLKSAFRSAAASSSDTQVIAEKLVGNSIIPFAGMAMTVEPGYLNGFNGEITGFSSGASFGPMIGTIPFIGYVFTVEGDTGSFISTLKSEANLRWNICTSADEMIVDSVGNTVFFLMCPTSFDE